MWWWGAEWNGDRVMMARESVSYDMMSSWLSWKYENQQITSTIKMLTAFSALMDTFLAWFRLNIGITGLANHYGDKSKHLQLIMLQQCMSVTAQSLFLSVVYIYPANGTLSGRHLTPWGWAALTIGSVVSTTNYVKYLKIPLLWASSDRAVTIIVTITDGSMDQEMRGRGIDCNLQL